MIPRIIKPGVSAENNTNTDLQEYLTMCSLTKVCTQANEPIKNLYFFEHLNNNALYMFNSTKVHVGCWGEI